MSKSTRKGWLGVCLWGIILSLKDKGEIKMWRSLRVWFAALLAALLVRSCIDVVKVNDVYQAYHTEEVFRQFLFPASVFILSLLVLFILAYIHINAKT